MNLGRAGRGPVWRGAVGSGSARQGRVWRCVAWQVRVRHGDVGYGRAGSSFDHFQFRPGEAGQCLAWRGVARQCVARLCDARRGLARCGEVRSGTARQGFVFQFRRGRAGLGPAGRGWRGLAWHGESGWGVARRGAAWSGEARRGMSRFGRVCFSISIRPGWAWLCGARSGEARRWLGEVGHGGVRHGRDLFLNLWPGWARQRLVWLGMAPLG